MAKKKLKSLNQPRGLFIHPNRAIAPDGALFLARNAVIDREGVVSPRRGFARYGTALSNVPSGLFVYDETLVVLDGTSLKRDSDGAGTWSAWSGSYSPPTSEDMRALEASKNFYFTTSNGVYVNDSVTGTPRKAGVPAGLDVQATRGVTLRTGLNWTRVTTTITAVDSGRILATGDVIHVSGSSDTTTIPDGFYTVTSGSIYTDDFTFTANNTGASSGTLNYAKFSSLGGWQGATQVGYRVVWKARDANDNTKRGAPSERDVVVNTTVSGVAWTRATTTATVTSTAHGLFTGYRITISGSSDTAAIPNGVYTVASTPSANSFTFTCVDAGAASGTLSYNPLIPNEVTTTLPDEVQAGDWLEIYRTEESASESTDPGDRHYLIGEREVLAADVTAGYMRAVDELDSSYLGMGLYTNDTEEGPRATNDEPPLARHLALFGGHAFYGRVTTRHQFALQLLDEDVKNKTPTSFSKVYFFVTNRYTSTLDATEDYCFSTSEDIGNRYFAVNTTEPTKAGRVRETAKSLCKVINRASSYLYAHYVSGPDDPPGMMVIRLRDFTHKILVQTRYSVDCNNFSPALTTYSGGGGGGGGGSPGEDAYSEGEDNSPKIWRSKFEQPEAVPALSYENPGRRDKTLLGLTPLRESLLIWKEDGVFTLSGDSDGNLGSLFVLDERDSTVKTVAPSSLALLDNAAWAVTTQGAYRLSVAGGGIASRAIEAEFERISRFTNFASLARAFAYESARKYFIPVPDVGADTRAKTLYLLNYLTATWTTWDLDVSRGVVVPGQDLLYLAHNVDKYILKERKTLTPDGADYKDWDIAATVTASGTTAYKGATVSTADVTYTYTTHAIEEGWLFTQGGTTSTIVAVSSLGGDSYRLTLDVQRSVAAAACTLTKGYEMVIEYAPEDDKTSGVLKRFVSCAVVAEQDGFHLTPSFKSDIQTTFEATDTIATTRTRGSSSMPWGAAADGDAPGKVTVARTTIPRNHSIGRSLAVRLSSKYAQQPCHISEVVLEFIPIGTRVQR